MTAHTIFAVHKSFGKTVKLQKEKKKLKNLEKRFKTSAKFSSKSAKAI